MTRTSTQGINLVLLCIIFIIVIVGQAIFFSDINLRNDEIVNIHAATMLDYNEAVHWLEQEATHPLGWNIFSLYWVEWFGYGREILRFHSVLFTLLALALTYRLGADLFDQQVAFMGTVFTAFTPFIFYHLHEFRPYPPLVALTLGYLVVYLRWLRQPTRLNTALFIGIGVLGLQTHYYFGLVCAALVGFHFLIVPSNGWRLRTFLLNNAIIFLSFGWWIPTIFARRSASSSVIYDVNTIQVVIVTIFLFNFMPLIGLFTILIPAKRGLDETNVNLPSLDNIFNNIRLWRVLFPLTIIIVSFILAMIGNELVRNMSPRNMLIVAPLSAILTAYAIRYYPLVFKLIAFGVFFIFSANSLDVYYFNYPFKEVGDSIDAEYQESDHVVLYINARRETAMISWSYYLSSYSDEELTSEDIYAIIDEELYGRNLFFFTYDKPYAIQQDAEPESIADFVDYITVSERFWLIEYVGPPDDVNRDQLEPYLDALSDYEIVKREVYEEDPFDIILYLYERIE